MTDRQLVPLDAQPYNDVLFVDLAAPAEHLYELALRRQTALDDLLRILELHETRSVLVHETARVASALAPLIGEARQLYELAQERIEASKSGA